MNKGLFTIFSSPLRQPVILCLASFFCCFFVALLLFLPLDPFARQLEQLAQKQGVQLQIDALHLRFPLGIGAHNIKISQAQLVHSPFHLQQVDLQPQWLSLMSKNPGFSFDLEAYQGRISGVIYRNGSLQAQLEGLNFSEPLGSKLPLTLEGSLKTGAFNGQLPLAGKNRSRLQLTMDNVQLRGLKKLGSSNDLLPLGQLSGTAEAKGPLIQISRLSVNGSAVEINASGSLRMGRTAASSSININLLLTPKSALDPALKDLLNLLKKPQADGRYRLNLRGSLTKPRIN